MRPSNFDLDAFCGNEAKRIAAQLRAQGKRAVLVELTPKARRWRALHDWHPWWSYHVVAVSEGRVFDPWWTGPVPTWDEYIEAAFGNEPWTMMVFNPRNDMWTPVPWYPSDPKASYYGSPSFYRMVDRIIRGSR